MPNCACSTGRRGGEECEAAGQALVGGGNVGKEFKIFMYNVFMFSNSSSRLVYFFYFVLHEYKEVEINYFYLRSSVDRSTSLQTKSAYIEGFLV